MHLECEPSLSFWKNLPANRHWANAREDASSMTIWGSEERCAMHLECEPSLSFWKKLPANRH